MLDVGLEVNLFPGTLSYVTDVEVAGRPVETEAPGIPDAVGPDLTPEGLTRGVGIGWGNRVRCGTVDVQPENRSEQGRAILAVPLGVAAGTTISQPNVQVSIGAEGQHAAVVVGERLRDAQDQLLAAAISHVRIGRDREAGHPSVAALVGVVDDEDAVLGVLRVECEPEETLLSTVGDLGVDIQERGTE